MTRQITFTLLASLLLVFATALRAAEADAPAARSQLDSEIQDLKKQVLNLNRDQIGRAHV